MAIAALSSPGPGRCRRAAAAPPPLPQPGREPAAAAVPAPTSLPFDRRRDLPTPRPLRGGSEPPAGRTGRPAGDASRSPPSPGAALPRREQTGQASRVCSVPVPRRPRPPPPPTPSRVLSLPGPGPLRRDRPHGCQRRRRAEPAPCWDTERGGGGEAVDGREWRRGGSDGFRSGGAAGAVSAVGGARTRRGGGMYKRREEGSWERSLVFLLTYFFTLTTGALVCRGRFPGSEAAGEVASEAAARRHPGAASASGEAAAEAPPGGWGGGVWSDTCCSRWARGPEASLLPFFPLSLWRKEGKEAPGRKHASRRHRYRSPRWRCGVLRLPSLRTVRPAGTERQLA